MGRKTDMFNSFCNKLNEKLTDIDQVLGQMQTDQNGQQYYSDQTTDSSYQNPQTTDSSYQNSQTTDYSYQDQQAQYSYQDLQTQYIDQQQQQQMQYMYQQQQAQQTLAPPQPSGSNSIMGIFNQSVNSINARYDAQAQQLAQCQTPLELMMFSNQQNGMHNMAMQTLYQGAGRPSKYWASNGDVSTW